MHSEGLPVDLFTSGEVRWLGIQVGLEAEPPRVLLVSVPYALKAGDAETLGGKPASAYMLSEAQSRTATGNTTLSTAGATQTGTSGTTQKSRTSNTAPLTACAAVTSGGTATVNSIARFTTACNIESSVITQSGNNVGIGTASPTSPLDITGPTNASVFLHGPGTHQYAISGATAGRLGQDVNGFFFASDTSGSSVRFLTNNGVLNEWMRITSAGNVGISTTTPAAKLEVNGTAKFDGAVSYASTLSSLGPVTIATPAATGSPAAALSVQATDLATANFGVYATSSGAGGTGVYGEADNGATSFGVWGRSTGGVAGHFDGDVQVVGNLSKSGGSFKIDHPLDPANMYLYHSFVESPDMKNVYDGVVTLDDKGEAVVQLPDWFEALNRDFRYQLTCIGGYAPVYVADEVANNQFRIAGGKPGLKISWQVTGIRQDAWANAHRIPVEEAKPAKEQGFYLSPALFGAPEDKGMSWAHHPARMRPRSVPPPTIK
jgi:hypothetical protein